MRLFLSALLLAACGKVSDSAGPGRLSQGSDRSQTRRGEGGATGTEKPAVKWELTFTENSFRAGPYEGSVGDDESGQTLRVERDGRTVWELSDFRVSIQDTFDFTGDGAPQFVITSYSGGAHCCFSTYVLALYPEPELLLALFTGNGTATLDRDNGEFVADFDGFAYFADLAYVESPFLPQWFAYRDGEFRSVHNEHKEELKALADSAFAALESDGEEGGEWDVLTAYGVGLLLGAGGGAAARLAVAAPDLMEWFYRHQEEIEKVMSEYGKLKKPEKIGEPEL